MLGKLELYPLDYPNPPHYVTYLRIVSASLVQSLTFKSFPVFRIVSFWAKKSGNPNLINIIFFLTFVFTAAGPKIVINRK